MSAPQWYPTSLSADACNSHSKLGIWGFMYSRGVSSALDVDMKAVSVAATKPRPSANQNRLGSTPRSPRYSTRSDS